MEKLILIAIILPTVIISIIALSNYDVFDKFKFNAFLIKSERQYYRFISHGFVHIDFMHLFLNMYVLWIFGELVVYFFNVYFGNFANLYFIGLYFPAFLASSLFSYYRYNNNSMYNAVGASGAVTAVVFASIILYPAGRMGLLFIPIMIPSWVFGLIYLGATIYLSKKQMDNVGHDAHLWGAVYGMAYTLITVPNSFQNFMIQIYNS